MASHTRGSNNHCSEHQVLHLVGKKQTENEVNVMDHIDNFPLQCQLLLFHVFTEENQRIFQHRICSLEMPFLLSAHGRELTNLSDSDCSVLLSPFQQNLPTYLSQHFLIRAHSHLAISWSLFSLTPSFFPFLPTLSCSLPFTHSTLVTPSPALLTLGSTSSPLSSLRAVIWIQSDRCSYPWGSNVTCCSPSRFHRYRLSLI